MVRMFDLSGKDRSCSVARNLDPPGYRISILHPDLTSVIPAVLPLSAYYLILHAYSRRLVPPGRFVHHRRRRRRRIHQGRAEQKATHHAQGNADAIVAMTARMTIVP